MGKIKPHRTNPSLDMTPMVDLGFLLVTFFMLTATAVPDEPVSVDTPSSVSEIKIPENNILLLTISNEGKVYFSLDGKFHRQELLKKMGEHYQIQFSPEDAARFGVMSSIGIPIQQLKEYIELAPEERKTVNQPGIPMDSLNNQLKDWIIFSRMTNPQVRIAIKGDQKANYPVVEKLMTILTDNNINRFNLITNQEKGGQ